MLILSIIVCVIVSVLMVLYKYPLVKVVGDSMYPTYHDGQYLKAVRVRANENFKVGAVYVYKTLNGDVVIKRLDHENDYGLFFIGDNVQCSFDSRSYGYIPRENVIAVTINP